METVDYRVLRDSDGGDDVDAPGLAPLPTLRSWHLRTGQACLEAPRLPDLGFGV